MQQQGFGQWVTVNNFVTGIYWDHFAGEKIAAYDSNRKLSFTCRATFDMSDMSTVQLVNLHFSIFHLTHIFPNLLRTFHDRDWEKLRSLVETCLLDGCDLQAAQNIWCNQMWSNSSLRKGWPSAREDSMSYSAVSGHGWEDKSTIPSCFEETPSTNLLDSISRNKRQNCKNESIWWNY